MKNLSAQGSLPVITNFFYMLMINTKISRTCDVFFRHFAKYDTLHR